MPKDVVVIGDWEFTFPGFCTEFEHRHRKATSLILSDTILQDPVGFTTVLIENEPKSLQLTSQESATLEGFFNLITCIGKNCPGLECLGINLILEEGEKKIQESEIIDLDLDQEENSPELLSEIQKSCVAAWRTFIDGVKPTFQHITIADMSVPFFALKWLVEDCPKFDYIDGGFSFKGEVKGEEKLTEVATPDPVVFINLVGVPDINLEKIWSKFHNLRIFWFDWSPGLGDLSIDFENPILEKLTNLVIYNRTIADAPNGSWEDKVPEFNMALPPNSRLRELTTTGLDLSSDCWRKLAERAKLLRSIYIFRGGNFKSELLEFVGNFERLEILNLEAENDVSGTQVVPLLTGLKKNVSKFHYELTFQKNSAKSNEEIEETVFGILESLKEVKEDCIEGKVGITFEFKEHKGGFDFLKSAVESRGYIFERDPDELESKIWNCNLNEGKQPPPKRSLSLEEKA